MNAAIRQLNHYRDCRNFGRMLNFTSNESPDH